MLAITPPGCDDVLAKLERGGDTNRFNRRIDTLALRQRHHLSRCIFTARLYCLCRTEATCNCEAVLVEVDHDDFGWRVQLRRQQRRQADRPAADYGDRPARLHLAIQHATLEAGWKNIAEHDEGLFVSASRDRVEAGVGMRNADVLGLGPVDGVTENPSAGRAVGVHCATAVVAFAARRDAGYQDVIALLELAYSSPGCFHDTHTLMTENAAGRAARHVAFENMQIRPADRRPRDLHDGVGCSGDRRYRPLHERLASRSFIDESLHRFLLHKLRWGRKH